MELKEAKILWVSAESEPQVREAFDRIDAVSVVTVASGLECCRAMRESFYCAIVASFPLPDCTADELLAEIQSVDPSTPVLIRDAAGTISAAVRLTKAGADPFFGADFDADEFTRQIEVARESRHTQDLAALSSAVGPSLDTAPAWRKNLVGSGPAMERVFRIIELVGQRFAARTFRHVARWVPRQQLRHAEVDELAHAVLDIELQAPERLHQRFDIEAFVRPRA